LRFNGSQNQALQVNVNTVEQNDRQTKQFGNLDCDQDLNGGSADESTTPKANSATGQGWSDMIKKASKFDFPDRNINSAPYDWTERIHNTVDLDTIGTAQAVNNEIAEKSQGIAAKSTPANALRTNDREQELGTLTKTIEKICALKGQDSTDDSTFSNSISLPEIIVKAAEHSATLQRKVGLSAKNSGLTDGIDINRQADSWMGLELSGNSYSGLSGDQAEAESLGKGSSTISAQQPGVDVDALSSHNPQRFVETQSRVDKLNTKSKSPASKSFGSVLIALGLIVLGSLVTFDSEKRLAPVPHIGAAVGSSMGGFGTAPVIKTSVESEHPEYDDEIRLFSVLDSVGTKKPSDRREANKSSESVNRQANIAKNQKYMLEIEFDTWLRLAEQQLSKKQLTIPKGDNALASYRTILKVDPVHNKALSGIQKIKETYMLWARNEIKRGNVRHARLLYQKALVAVPKDADVLTALEGLKSNQMSSTKRLADKPDTAILKFESGYEQVAGLLDRANRQMYLNQLVVPAGNNALSTYRKVLRLAPHNSEALDGIVRIRSTYLNWAKSAMDNQDWDRAEVFYERALQADPTDRTVIPMIQELKRRRYSNR